MRCYPSLNPGRHSLNIVLSGAGYVENRGPYHERAPSRSGPGIGSCSNKYCLKDLIWKFMETSGGLKTLRQRIRLYCVKTRGTSWKDHKPTVLCASSASISDIIGLSGLRTSGLGTSRRFLGRFMCGFIVVCGTVVTLDRLRPQGPAATGKAQ